jgi:hypothetical protein
MDIEVDLVSELLNKCNEGLQYYEIVLTNECIGEDGSMMINRDETPLGYALINRTTGITEHTSQVLPAILWQVQHLEQTLTSLLEPEKTGPVGVDSDDVIPMLQ